MSDQKLKQEKLKQESKQKLKRKFEGVLDSFEQARKKLKTSVSRFRNMDKQAAKYHEFQKEWLKRRGLERADGTHHFQIRQDYQDKQEHDYLVENKIYFCGCPKGRNYDPLEKCIGRKGVEPWNCPLTLIRGQLGMLKMFRPEFTMQHLKDTQDEWFAMQESKATEKQKQEFRFIKDEVDHLVKFFTDKMAEKSWHMTENGHIQDAKNKTVYTSLTTFYYDTFLPRSENYAANENLSNLNSGRGDLCNCYILMHLMPGWQKE